MKEDLIFNKLLDDLENIDYSTKLSILEKYRSTFAQQVKYINDDDKEFKERVISYIKECVDNSENSKMDYSLLSDYISVFDYSIYMMKFMDNWHNLKKEIDKKLGTYVMMHSNRNYSSGRVTSFNNEYKILTVNLKYYDGDGYSISVEKKDGSLHLYKGSNELFAKYYNVLNDVYDSYVLFETIITHINDLSYDSVDNTFNFRIYSGIDSVHINLTDIENGREIVGFDYLNGICIVYDNGTIFSKILAEKGKDFLSRSYLKISDLPIYFQDDLLALRKQELSEFQEEQQNNSVALEQVDTIVTEPEQTKEETQETPKVKQNKFSFFGIKS